MQYLLEGGIVQSRSTTSLPSGAIDSLAVYPVGYDVYADFGITPDQLERLIAAGLISPIEVTPLPPDTEIIITP